MEETVKFLVNDVVYGIPLIQLVNFPLENTLLRLLYEKYRLSEMLIETIDS